MYSPYLQEEFSVIVLESPVLSVLFDPDGMFLVFFLSPVPSDLSPQVVLFVLLMCCFYFFVPKYSHISVCFSGFSVLVC